QKPSKLFAPHHVGDRGSIFFDHDALFVAEINSRPPAGLRPEVANLIHVQIEGHLLSFAHQREGNKFSHEASPVRHMNSLTAVVQQSMVAGTDEGKAKRLAGYREHGSAGSR